MSGSHPIYMICITDRVITARHNPLPVRWILDDPLPPSEIATHAPPAPVIIPCEDTDLPPLV